MKFCQKVNEVLVRIGILRENPFFPWQIKQEDHDGLISLT